MLVEGTCYKLAVWLELGVEDGEQYKVETKCLDKRYGTLVAEDRLCHLTHEVIGNQLERHLACVACLLSCNLPCRQKTRVQRSTVRPGTSQGRKPLHAYLCQPCQYSDKQKTKPFYGKTMASSRTFASRNLCRRRLYCAVCTSV